MGYGLGQHERLSNGGEQVNEWTSFWVETAAILYVVRSTCVALFYIITFIREEMG